MTVNGKSVNTKIQRWGNATLVSDPLWWFWGFWAPC